MAIERLMNSTSKLCVYTYIHTHRHTRMKDEWSATHEWKKWKLKAKNAHNKTITLRTIWRAYVHLYCSVFPAKFDPLCVALSFLLTTFPFLRGNILITCNNVIGIIIPKHFIQQHTKNQRKSPHAWNMQAIIWETSYTLRTRVQNRLPLFFLLQLFWSVSGLYLFPI